MPLEWVLVAAHAVLVWTVGFALALAAFAPCALACGRPRWPRAAEWRGGALAIAIAWCAPMLLWYVFLPPLTVCTPRAVYSYPMRHAGQPWEAFWCARPCADAPVVRPSSVDELRATVAQWHSLRAVGSGHSTSDLQCADPGGAVVSYEVCGEYAGVDAAGIVQLDAGCTVEHALRHMARDGWQLRGYGAIAEQRLGGAISTSLHGQHPQSFADHLVGLSAVLANGTLLTLGPDSDELWAWPGSMGTLGVITSVRLRAWPLEFVECTSEPGDAAQLHAALSAPNVVGFEAKRMLADDPYTIRTCVAAASPTDPVHFIAKDTIGAAFVTDNVLLSALILLGVLVTRSAAVSNRVFGTTEAATSRDGVVTSLNDYRNRVSYSPLFDEEYVVPIAECHATLEQIRALPGGKDMHAFLRRVDAGSGWLRWGATDSCAIRLEDYLDYGNFDAVRSKRALRREIELAVVERGGSGHFGKVWHGNASLLLRHSPRARDFEAYRVAVDPLGKFQNDYTREMRGAGRRGDAALPEELEHRARVWRAAVWAAAASSVALGAIPWVRRP